MPISTVFRKTTTLFTLSALACTAGAPAAIGQQEEPYPAVFKLVPPGSAAALVVPNLKGASDDLAQAFEGMDRANLLFGGRPVDQLRALLGLTAGVNEEAPVAIVMTSVQGWDTPVFLIPVLNEVDFMQTNFDPDPSGRENAYIHHGTGRVLFARRFQNHVALCENEPILVGFEPGGGLVDQLTKDFDQAVEARVRQCDILLFERADAVRAIVADAVHKPANRSNGKKKRKKKKGGNEGAADPPAADRRADSGFSIPGTRLARILPDYWWESTNTVLTGINFDPLGVGVHSFLSLKKGSVLEAMSMRAVDTSATLARLPDAPFYLAGTVDFGGMGGSDLFFRDMFDWAMLADGVRRMNVILSPSAAGLRGGVLNGASVYLETDDSAGLMNLMKTQFELFAAAEADSLTLTPGMQENARKIGGVSVHAYTIDIGYTGNNALTTAMIPLAAGRAGVSGFVGEIEGGVIITFAQRPDVFERAVKAAHGEASLAENPMLQQMSAWLPAKPDIKVFLGVGQIGQLMNQLLKSFGPLLAAEFNLPPIDESTKPIGFGLDVRPGLIEFGAVLPADAAAVVIDAIIDQFELVAVEPERQ